MKILVVKILLFKFTNVDDATKEQEVDFDDNLLLLISKAKGKTKEGKIQNNWKMN